MSHPPQRPAKPVIIGRPASSSPADIEAFVQAFIEALDGAVTPAEAPDGPAEKRPPGPA